MMDKQEPNNSCCTNCCRLCCMCPSLMRKGFEKVFGSLGKTIARFPWVTIAICVIIVGACAVGLMFAKSEDRVEKLYIPPDSTSLKDLDRAMKHFPQMDTRSEKIIFVPKSGSNILTPACFLEVLQLHDAITSLKDFEKYCVKHSGKCIFSNPVELFNFDKNMIQNISETITKAYNWTGTILRDGRPLVMSFGRIFARPLWTNGALQSASAIQVTYHVTNAPGLHESVSKWEETFIKKITDMKSGLKHVEVYLEAGRSLGDAISESVASDISLFSITFALMITFACVSLLKFKNPLTGHGLIAMVGIIAVGLGILAGLGLAMYAGAPFISIVGILPFLILGIGIDDVFIIVDELDRVDVSKHSVSEVVKLVMARSGATITMTTLTDLVAFTVSTSTSFPSIRYFCIYAALTITCSYLMVVTFFVAFLSFEVRRIKARRRDFLPICRAPPEKEGQPPWTTPSQAISSNIMHAWGKALMLTPIRVIVVLISCGLLGVSIFYALKISESFDRRLLAKKDNYIMDFLNIQEKYYDNSFLISIITDSKLDYSTSEVQTKILHLSKIATENPYYLNKTVSWVESFKSLAHQANVSSTGPSFMALLKQFLEIPVFSHFKQDVVLSPDNSSVVASRVLCFMESTSSSVRQKDGMLELRSDLSSQSDLPVYASAKVFIYLEQYTQTKTETTRNVIVAGVAVLVIIFPFLLSLRATLLVVLGFGAVICELFALMYAWDVSLNMISTINIVMAIGFSVDYSAHIAHAYVMSTNRKPEDRAVYALSTVGASVFMGGVSTFLGIVVTAFASSEVFRIFFKMFLGIVVLGLLHGLCFLPVYLSILCRWVPVKVEDTKHSESKPSINGHRNMSFQPDNNLELLAKEDIINKNVKPIFQAVTGPNTNQTS